jgi:hypothetical protein
MKCLSVLFVFLLFVTACNSIEKEDEFNNIVRNELAGTWRIHRIHQEGVFIDSVKGVLLTEFDTIYEGINSYYTMMIPTVKNQWGDEKLGYGVLQNEYFDFTCQAETNNRKLSMVQFDRIFCETCSLKSNLFINYIMSSWNVKEYKIRERLTLSRYFYINGVKRVSLLELTYENNI